MAVLDIVRLGHPALRTPAEPVADEALGGESLAKLVADMIETMEGASGVGLAAPQVGVGLQVFVYRRDGPGGEPGGGDTGAVVNPMLVPEPGELVYDWEGCLSIPELRGLVPRHPEVRVQGVDPSGGSLDFEADGFEARVIQHEFDHLNGVVFLDRMRDLHSLAFEAEWQRYLAGGEEGSDEPAVG